MIPDSFKQDLLNRIDIVELIERYVTLKKGGANYMACCPFHSEKTPSFTVSPTKQFYHCFGCGAHGNAISFLMEYQGLGYVDAVKELAESAGMKLPEMAHDAPAKRAGPDLLELMERASRYYREQLKSAPQAIDYLKGRGLTGKIALRFGIGYAPAGWQSLRSVYTDYEGAALKEAGLVIDAESGRRYDRFRDRIMFPILNQRGSVIGFGGRVLGDGEPKYLNSPETPLFEKGRELYGLPQAREAIRAQGRVLVVEGYMDVVALAQHGVECAVATLGTATTPAHLQKLFRLSDEVVFCFDGDAAGRRAAWHALEVALPSLSDTKAVRFMFLPAEHDPDSFVRELGREAFEAAMGAARPLSEFLLAELKSRCDMASPEGRSRFLAEAEPLFKRIAAPVLRLQLQKQLLAAADFDRDDIERLTGRRSAPSMDLRKPAAPAREPRRMVEGQLETKILAYLILCPKLADQVPRELFDPGNARDSTILVVTDFIAQHLAEDRRGRDCGAMLLDAFAQASDHLSAIRGAQTWGMTMGFGAEEAEAEFGPALDKRRDRLESERQRYLGDLIKKGQASPDEEREFAVLSMRARRPLEGGGDAVSDHNML